MFFLILSLGASFVNGALGYGFSSLSIPIAVLFFPNRILNPAFVLVELLVNSSLLVYERRYFKLVMVRTAPIVGALLPGVVVGSYLLSAVHPEWVRIFLYVFLLPLILLQASGFRQPIKAESAFKVPFGVVLGIFYSLTTISGPPLALFLNNQVSLKTNSGLRLHKYDSQRLRIRVWPIGCWDCITRPAFSSRCFS